MNPNPSANRYGPNPMNTNLALQKSQTEIYNVFTSVERILSEPLMQYERILAKQT